VFKKNISDGVPSRNESIDTPLYTPHFWLDNIKTPPFLLFSMAKGGTKTIAHLSIAEGSSF
jgi:hypothetical protein